MTRRGGPALVLLSIVVALVAATMACGSNADRSFEDVRGDAGMSFSEAGPLCEGGVRACTADLHGVADCAGRVTEACRDDQGCADGTCVAACASARANRSAVGCDYFVAPPGQYVQESRGACFAAFIANTWGTPVTIGVEYGGRPLDVAGLARIPQGSGTSITYAPLPGGALPPGAVAILFLAQSDDGNFCPPGVSPGVIDHVVQPLDTTIVPAFHVTTSAPVVAYDEFPYGGASSVISSATLLVPTSAWGTNYVGVEGYPASALAPHAQPFLQIVAATDGTAVTVRPAAALVGGNGVEGSPAGVPHTYELAAGQLLQFAEDADLSGSIIQSNLPIGVWGGSTCMNIDVTEGACDAAHQELFPVQALGSEYAATRYRDRVAGQVESVPWRIVGAVDGTTLTYDPAPPAGAPATMESGQVALFWDPGPFVVRSQDADHPFYVGGHMTGYTHLANNPNGEGDPEFVNVLPPAEWLASYVFFTDVTFSQTNLVVTRRKATNGAFADVTIDCVGVVSGFRPIGAGEYDVATVDLVVDGAAQGACANGRHDAHSDAPFGLTVWGWDFAVSYAYPAGASVKPINDVVVPPVPH